MDINVWLAFASASFLLVVIPGPTVLLVVSYALSHGRKVAVATALGVALGDTIAVTSSLTGLGALLLTSAWVFTGLKWIGAAYLVYLGYKMLKTTPDELEISGARGTTTAKTFAHAAMVTALNPKGILFFLAFVPQFIRTETPLVPQFITMLITFVALGVINALVYAILAARLRDHMRKPSLRRLMNRVGGLTLITMGAMSATLTR